MDSINKDKQNATIKPPVAKVSMKIDSGNRKKFKQKTNKKRIPRT